MSTKKNRKSNLFHALWHSGSRVQKKHLLFPHLDILEEAVVTVVEDRALYSVESPLGSIGSGSIPPKTVLWLCCYIFQP